MILKNIIKIYIIMGMSIILHELGHWIVAKIFKFKNVKIVIGDKFYSINTKYFRFSPLIISGYVEFNFTPNITKKQIICFYLSGSFVNIVLIIMSLLFNKLFNEWIYLLIVNSLSVIFNLFPLKKLSNDFGNLYNDLIEINNKK